MNTSESLTSSNAIIIAIIVRIIVSDNSNLLLTFLKCFLTLQLSSAPK